MYGDTERGTASDGWHRAVVDSGAATRSNVVSPMDDKEHFCKLILYKEIADSRVRIWDVAILVPNLIFLLFIAARFNRARLKLRATSSPIFLAFYGLVVCNLVISVIRCVVSMTVNAAATVGGKADKVLWVTVRFFLLSTEMSVVIFGLAFGHLDSRSSIRRVLLATSFIALAFTITQGTLELVLPDDTFRIPSRDFYVFGHGGMMFWFCSSLVFASIYILILILPWTRLRERLALPTRKSFYVYAGTLATLDLIQSIGAGLLNYTQNPTGLCVVDLTAAVYLTLFTPLVYHTFLSEFFGISQPSIMFSYKAQVDDAMDEDTVSLPHQQSFSSLKTDSDYIYQVHTPSIHMPLYYYDPPMPKSSASKHGASSLYSLTSKRDPKADKIGRTSSQVTLYGTSPGTKDRSKHQRGTLNSTPDLVGNCAPIESESSAASRKSAPNLNFEIPSWNVGSTGKVKRGHRPTSISHLVLSPPTAAAAAGNIICRSKSNGNADLLSASSGGSLENMVKTFEFPDRLGSASRNGRIKGAEVKILGRAESSRVTPPPLENSLRNILDSRTRDFSSTGEAKGVVSSSTFKQRSSSSRRSEESSDVKPFNRRTNVVGGGGGGGGEVRLNESFEVSSSGLSGTKLSRNETSGGLSDYLSSLSSS